MASDTGSEPEPEIRRGVVLPRIGAVPGELSFAPTDPAAPGGTDPRSGGPAFTAGPRHRRSGRSTRSTRSTQGPDETRPGRRLAFAGAACAVVFATVAGVVAFAPVWSGRGLAPSPPEDRGPAALNPMPPVPSRAGGVTSSPGIQATFKTYSPSPPSPAPSRSGGSAAAHHWQTLVVHATYVLHPGESVRSNRLTLSLLPAGDLVLRDENGRVTWSTGTRAQGTQAVFQADGNLVLYQGGTTLWSSRTDGHDGATLELGADGAMRIEYGGTTLWSTG
jgi:hypothetical protein